MKKQFLKLLTITMSLLLLCACSSSKITENGTVNATTRISYSISEDKIKVSNVIIKCNDSYYGVTINDSINFNSNSNYLTTGSGLTVYITSDKLKTGSSSSDGVYTAVSKIEDGAYLYVSGTDEEKAKEIFNNVFKTNKASYTFLAHDISDEWTKEVNITEDVISFSNGTDTIYAYQNDGSLSDGCINGRIEPTVFKKALRGIDIPITYPEDIEEEWDYIPYGVEEYEHLIIDGYTPYSAYQISEYTTESKPYGDGTIDLKVETTTSDEMVNYILLAKDDSSILSLFNDENDHTQNLYSLSIPNGNPSLLGFDAVLIDLSDKKDIATSVINSENRYHFGVLDENDEDGTISYTGANTEPEVTNYYVDNSSSWTFDVSGYNFTISNTMYGKLVIPTIKVSVPLYDFKTTEGNNLFGFDPDVVVATEAYKALSSKGVCYNNTNNCLVPYDYYYAADINNWVMHGLEFTINEYLTSTNSISTGGNYHFVNEGDYAYQLDGVGKMTIYKFDATDYSYNSEERYGYSYSKGLITELKSYDKLDNEENILETCSYTVSNGFNEHSIKVSTLSYQR